MQEVLIKDVMRELKMDRWLRSKRSVAWMVCILLPVAVIGLLGYKFFGTLWGGAEKVAGHMEYKINEELKFKDVTVIPNKPKYGDVTVNGQVGSHDELAKLQRLANENTDSVCKVHVQVNVKTHNKPGLDKSATPPSSP